MQYPVCIKIPLTTVIHSPIVAPFAGCLFGGFLYDVFIYTGPESPINRYGHPPTRVPLCPRC